jgi:hypothetical protein
MAKNKRISGIDIDEDIVYQEREWKAQRVGWVIIWLLLLAALLGVFGKGVLSDAQAADPTQVLSVKYARFERYRSPTTIELVIGPTLTGAGKFAIALNREFVDRVSIDRIDPEPESVKSDSNRLLYEFEVTADNQPAHVYINYEYAQFGASEVQINLENGPALVLHQFVYP